MTWARVKFGGANGLERATPPSLWRLIMLFHFFTRDGNLMIGQFHSKLKSWDIWWGCTLVVTTLPNGKVKDTTLKAAFKL